MSTDPSPESPIRATWRRWNIAAALGVTTLAAVALHGLGRQLWCKCGTPSPWSWNIWSMHGDTILNSVADVAAFALGYTAAIRLPVRISALVFLAVEAGLLLTIRDSLLLNVLMLLHPIEAIRVWQMGG